MRLTMRTNLAMRALMYCAVNAGTTVRKSEIAERCNASENHLGQVVRMLARFDLVKAFRGRSGGIRLARPADEISVGEVFRLFEFEHPFAECFEGSVNTCPLKASCWLRPALHKALEAFYASLDALSLADLITGNDDLDALLRIQPAGMPAEAGRALGCPAA